MPSRRRCRAARSASGRPSTDTSRDPSNSRCDSLDADDDERFVDDLETQRQAVRPRVRRRTPSGSSCARPRRRRQTAAPAVGTPPSSCPRLESRSATVWSRRWNAMRPPPLEYGIGMRVLDDARELPRVFDQLLARERARLRLHGRGPSLRPRAFPVAEPSVSSPAAATSTATATHRVRRLMPPPPHKCASLAALTRTPSCNRARNASSASAMSTALEIQGAPPSHSTTPSWLSAGQSSAYLRFATWMMAEHQSGRHAHADDGEHRSTGRSARCRSGSTAPISMAETHTSVR